MLFLVVALVETHDLARSPSGTLITKCNAHDKRSNSADSDDVACQGDRTFQTFDREIPHLSSTGLQVPVCGSECEGARQVGRLQVLDSNKKLLGVADIYPSGMDLPAGDLTLRVFIRHDDCALLDKLKHLPMVHPSSFVSPMPSSLPIHTFLRKMLLFARLDFIDTCLLLVPALRNIRNL